MSFLLKYGVYTAIEVLPEISLRSSNNPLSLNMLFFYNRPNPEVLTHVALFKAFFLSSNAS